MGKSLRVLIVAIMMVLISGCSAGDKTNRSGVTANEEVNVGIDEVADTKLDYTFKGYTFKVDSTWVGKELPKISEDSFEMMAFEKSGIKDKILITVDVNSKLIRNGKYIYEGIELSIEEMVDSARAEYKEFGYEGIRVETLSTDYGDAWLEADEEMASIMAIYGNDVINVIGYKKGSTEDIEKIIIDIAKSIKK